MNLTREFQCPKNPLFATCFDQLPGKLLTNINLPTVQPCLLHHVKKKIPETSSTQLQSEKPSFNFPCSFKIPPFVPRQTSLLTFSKYKESCHNHLSVCSCRDLSFYFTLNLESKLLDCASDYIQPFSKLPNAFLKGPYYFTFFLTKNENFCCCTFPAKFGIVRWGVFGISTNIAAIFWSQDPLMGFWAGFPFGGLRT